MDRCLEILREYDHLVAHDSVGNDCSKATSFSCMFRIYGVTVLTIGGFIAGGIMYFK